MAEMQWNKPGQGSTRDSGSMRRIVVSFDEDTFAQVRRRALKNGVSFGATVRELVEFGLIEAEAA